MPMDLATFGYGVYTNAGKIRVHIGDAYIEHNVFRQLFRFCFIVLDSTGRKVFLSQDSILCIYTMQAKFRTLMRIRT